MKLSAETLKTVDNLAEITGEGNRTRLISTSLRLMEDILVTAQKSKVVVEHENGDREVLKFIGI